MVVLLQSGARPQGSPDEVFIKYFGSTERRLSIERESGQDLRQDLETRKYEVVLELRGAIRNDVLFPELGFEVLREPPATCWLKTSEGLLFARFTDIDARTHEDAVLKARRRLFVLVSSVSLARGHAIELDVGEANVRIDGAEGWGGIYRRTSLPIGVESPEDWRNILVKWQPILNAEDDLAVRIQEANIHLHRCRASYGVEEKLDEAWKVLELLSGHAGKKGAALLCYLPLWFIPAEFKDFTGRRRMAFLREEYERLTKQFKTVDETRNKVMAHRERPRADWAVIQHHAVWAESFARDAILGAATGWINGARQPMDVVNILKKSYEKGFGIKLPTKTDIERG